MPYRSLDEFIIRLEQTGELIHVPTPVSPELEITAVVTHMRRLSTARQKALLFENVAGSRFPLVVNLLSSERRMVWALGLDHLDMLGQNLAKLIDPNLPQGFGALMNRAGELLGLLRSLSPGPNQAPKAPVQEVVITRDPDVNIFPILRHWPGDEYQRITAAPVIMGGPASSPREVNLYDVVVYDGQTLGLRFLGSPAYTKPGNNEGRKIPAAIVLGGDPAITWCASLPLPPTVDKYLVASWVRGRGVPFVNGVTQDLAVPAEADIIIEGWLDPDENRSTGRLAADSGYYTPGLPAIVMHVTAITHRQRAIFPAAITGKPGPDTIWLNKAVERFVLPLTRLLMHEIIDVNVHALHSVVIVSARPSYKGHAQKIMYGLWGLGWTMTARVIIVVDADADVHNLDDIARRLAQNVNWRRDVTIVDGPVDSIHLAALDKAYGGKIGIDAARKPDRAAKPDRAPVRADQMTAFLGENWRIVYEMLLVVGIDPTHHQVNDVLHTLWTLCPDYNIVILDHDVDIHDLGQVAWQVTNNVDWRRDVVLNGGPLNPYDTASVPGQIGIDATRKSAQNGEQPQAVEMTPAVRSQVDKKWKTFGI